MTWLVRKNSTGKRAHIWTGTDTACRLYSTGGMRQSKFEVVEDKGDREVCLMCLNNSKEEGGQR